jgi:hypothetical protein
VEWMCATPRAAASAIADRVSQSSGVRPEARFPAFTKPRDPHHIIATVPHSKIKKKHIALLSSQGQEC